MFLLILSRHTAALIRTLCLVDVLPAVCTTQHILCALGLHVLAFVVAAVEDHLVGACATFEAVLSSMDLVRGSEFVVFEGIYCEHVAAGGTDWCMLLVLSGWSRGGGIEAYIAASWQTGLTRFQEAVFGYWLSRVSNGMRKGKSDEDVMLKMPRFACESSHWKASRS